MTVRAVRTREPIRIDGRLDEAANAEAEGDRRLKDLAAMLAPYAREGTYGKYFDREASIDFDSDFIACSRPPMVVGYIRLFISSFTIWMDCR
mgnify:CR=1 FL=1